MTMKHERRFCRVSLRVSAREKSAIETAATRTGFCLSDYLRRVVLGAKPLRARRRPALETFLAARLLVQLGAIASELRAIARAAASEFTPLVERELARALYDLRDCRTWLMKALGRKAGPR